MRKHVSPTVALFMGLFMILSAVVYMAIIMDIYDPSTTAFNQRFLLALPALVLTLWGISTFVWAMVMRPMLRFSHEADGWVLK